MIELIRSMRYEKSGCLRIFFQLFVPNYWQMTWQKYKNITTLLMLRVTSSKTTFESIINLKTLIEYCQVHVRNKD